MKRPAPIKPGAALTLFAALCAFFVAAPALAHKASDSYLSLESSGKDSRSGTLQGRWSISLRDLDDAIGLDDNGDGAITWAELRAHRSDVEAYALPKLRFRAGGAACALKPGAFQVDDLSDGGYAVLDFSLDCPVAADALELSYSLLFELDPTHRGLVRAGGAVVVFSPQQPVQALALRVPGNKAGETFAALREGARSAWPGAFFLVALLAPAGLRGRAALAALFAAASSAALVLAATASVAVSSRPLAAAVALSLLLALASNRIAFLRKRPLAFFAGLAHGLWLAASLLPLRPLPDPRVLLSFNLGALFGELALASAVLFALVAAQRALSAGARLGQARS